MIDRQVLNGVLIHDENLDDAGLTLENLSQAILYTHKVLDDIDLKLVEVGVDKISQIIELANFSSMMGNLLGAGIEKFSIGRYQRNGPHKYPDLLSLTNESKDIEIKISLENNKPKGHLAKEGFYLIFRYVLGSSVHGYTIGERGDTAIIYEARFGYLLDHHFNVSNTAGDSGKTAVVNKLGMDELKTVYIDLDACPYTKRSPTYKKFAQLVQGNQ